MSTVIYNPTNETFLGTYVGEDTIIGPDEKIKVDDARANHFLNKFGRRGLIPLDYGDEGDVFEKKVRAALEKNKAFKEKAVSTYNQTNLFRKHQNLEYMQPPKHVKAYAEELGLKLIQPYMPEDTETPRMRELESENKSKDKQISDMQSQINELSNMLQRFITDQTAAKRPAKKISRKKPDAETANQEAETESAE
jgi:hypothetical protein